MTFFISTLGRGHPLHPLANNPKHARFHLLCKPEIGGKSSRLDCSTVPLLREATRGFELKCHSLDTLSSCGRHAVESFSTSKEVDLERLSRLVPRMCL